MKQHITPEQLNELSNRGKKASVEAFEHELLPNIGQMIEFLDEQGCLLKIIKGRESGDYYISDWRNVSQIGLKHSLCDALWEAVKKILEK